MNWIMKTLVTKRNRQDLRNNQRAELKHFGCKLYFFFFPEKQRQKDIMHVVLPEKSADNTLLSVFLMVALMKQSQQIGK